MVQIDINLAQKTNQEIGDLFWDRIQQVYTEESCPEIFLNANGTDFNPEGFKHLRKQVLYLGLLQQTGEMKH